ncbi:TraR/DksA family transcriptional regulator, partial [Salmonella enterica]|nr:TraR/DksA family transcriptional regulator [Salmonella enterica]
ECGDNLPEARRKAYPGFTMCVECQSNMELRKKIGRV